MRLTHGLQSAISTRIDVHLESRSVAAKLGVIIADVGWHSDAALGEEGRHR